LTKHRAYATVNSDMKLRSTTPDSLSFFQRAGIVIIVFVMALAVPIQFGGRASADDFDEKIRALEQDISRYDAEAAELANQANTLEREVGRLNNEKATIQAQIDISQARYDQLVKDIAANEQKIADNQDALGEILADLYVDDTISPIEMLASSQNIGDFLNKQEYRAVTRDELSSTITEIRDIKAELEVQKTDVENVLADQTNQRNALAAKESEQRTLLSQTRGSEASYRSLSEQAEAQKEELQRQQQAAIEAALRAAGGGVNAVAGDPNKGGYPANLANSNYYAPLVDPWGMYSRQCVSYTAWKVFQKNGYMPYWGGVGNANQWPGNARNAGIPVSTVPRAGSVGVIMAGQYGHTVWVESVNSNGSINISQYNYWNAGGSGWGHYSEMYNVSPAAYDYYIYF
jgi:peptidoglycan DL-endopeptidase CwlO